MALNGGGGWIPVSLRVSLNGVQQTVQGSAQVAGGIRKMKDAADSTRKGFANLAGAFTGIVAASFVKDALAAVIKPAMDFQTALYRIKMLTGGTEASLRSFRVEAMRVAAITPYGPTQMLNVLLKLQRALGDTKAAKAALEPTSQLAMASFGAMTPEKSAEMMSQMIRGFGLGAGDVQTAGERVFAASKRAGLGIEDYANVMGKLATASTLGGQSLDETFKMFSFARRELPSSERAATLLMSVMSELIKPKVSEGLGRLGIATVDAMGHPRKMGEIMLELAERYKGSSREVRNAINLSFGKQAAKPVLAILNQLTGAFRDQNGQILEGRAAYDYLSQGMQNSKGILKEASEVYMKTAAAQWQEMVENLSNLGIVIGEFLLPRLNALAGGLKRAFSAAKGFFETGVGKAIASFAVPMLSWLGMFWAGAAALQGIGKIALVVTKNLLGIFGALKKIAGIAGVIKGMQGLGGMLGLSGIGGGIVSAIGRILGPIGLLITAAGLLYKSIKDHGLWGTLNYQMREGQASANDNMMKGASSIYQTLMREQQKLLNEKKAADELSVKSAKEWYSYIQLGTEQWTKSINAFKGIIEYKPPKIEAGTMYTLGGQFAASEKRLKGKAGSEADYNLAVTARGTMLEVNRLLGIAYTNPKGLSPRQADTLRTAAKSLSVWGEKLHLPGVEAFKKRFALQALQIGSRPSIDWTTDLLKGSGGRLPGPENEMIPGWNPGVGGYAGPGAKEPYAEGYLKNVWGLTSGAGAPQSSVLGEMFGPTSSRAPDDFLRGAAEAQKRKREERLAQLDNAMRNIVTAMQRLTGTLSGDAIRVKLEGKDPAAGGGAGGAGLSDPLS